MWGTVHGPEPSRVRRAMVNEPCDKAGHVNATVFNESGRMVTPCVALSYVRLGRPPAPNVAWFEPDARKGKRG